MYSNSPFGRLCTRSHFLENASSGHDVFEQDTGIDDGRESPAGPTLHQYRPSHRQNRLWLKDIMFNSIFVEIHNAVNLRTHTGMETLELNSFDIQMVRSPRQSHGTAMTYLLSGREGVRTRVILYSEKK